MARIVVKNGVLSYWNSANTVFGVKGVIESVQFRRSFLGIFRALSGKSFVRFPWARERRSRMHQQGSRTSTLFAADGR